MLYTIEQSPSDRKHFGAYWYRIFRDGVYVAQYWHDHRGDEHGVEFASGAKAIPYGRVSDFLLGGGGAPLMLNDSAIEFLEKAFKAGAAV